MPITPHDKRTLLRTLLTTKSAAIDLEFELIMAERDDDARDIGRRIDRLSRQTKALRGALWDDWTGRASALTAEFRKANTDLRRAIRDIQRDIKTAERVVKSLAILDQVIATAATLLA
jgi:hypothetical protein